MCLKLCKWLETKPGDLPIKALFSIPHCFQVPLDVKVILRGEGIVRFTITI